MSQGAVIRNAGGGLTEERMRREDREEREQSKPKAFSSVGSTEAEELLASLDVMEMDGNVVDPVVLPKDCPTCSSFDYSKYCNETAGTCDLLAHHQAELAKMGVVFGRGGYQMYDLHKRPSLYTIKTASGRSYGGNIDGCLSPFGLMPTSAARQCRIAFEHKQSANQKQGYRDQQSTEVRCPGALRCLVHAVPDVVQTACWHLHVRVDGATHAGPIASRYMGAWMLNGLYQHARTRTPSTPAEPTLASPLVTCHPHDSTTWYAGTPTT